MILFTVVEGGLFYPLLNYSENFLEEFQSSIEKDERGISFGYINSSLGKIRCHSIAYGNIRVDACGNKRKTDLLNSNFSENIKKTYNIKQ